MISIVSIHSINSYHDTQNKIEHHCLATLAAYSASRFFLLSYCSFLDEYLNYCSCRSYLFSWGLIFNSANLAGVGFISPYCIALTAHPDSFISTLGCSTATGCYCLPPSHEVPLPLRTISAPRCCIFFSMSSSLGWVLFSKGTKSAILVLMKVGGLMLVTGIWGVKLILTSTVAGFLMAREGSLTSTLSLCRGAYLIPLSSSTLGLSASSLAFYISSNLPLRVVYSVHDRLSFRILFHAWWHRNLFSWTWHRRLLHWLPSSSVIFFPLFFRS